jgi:hypothetical protein
MAPKLEAETFAPHVGETFEVVPSVAGERFEAVLSSCEDTPYGSREELRETLGRVPFSLMFHAPDPSWYAPQQTFSLRHPELGELDLFLVPLGPDDRGMRYQAVIS